MSYLKILNFTREPFSNSPDPQSYYPTGMHNLCLHRLEIAIQLKRGLNVVLGEVGTGKSTLMRTLLQMLNEQENLLTYVILDPNFPDEMTFIRHLHTLLDLPPWDSTSTDSRSYIEEVQAATFNLAIRQGKTLVLLIDEAQKLQPACLEVLRTLLNFETNTEKLFQIVLFGQLEMLDTLAAMPNFKDRVNEFIRIQPLSFRETAGLIRYRLRKAGGPKAEKLFTLPALYAIHRISYGRPRRIMHLCHRFLLTLVIQNKPRVTWGAVRAEKKRMDILGDASPMAKLKPQRSYKGIVALVVCVLLLVTGITLAPEIPVLHGMLNAKGWIRTENTQPQPGITAQPETEKPATPPETGVKTTLQRLNTAQNPESVQEAGPEKTALSSAPATTGDEKNPNTTPPDQPEIPLLGVYQLNKGESLTRVVMAFYGTLQPVLPTVMKANPQIKDANRVPSGTSINLPAIPKALPERYTQQFFLNCGNFDTPQDTYAAYGKIRRTNPNVLIVPYAFSQYIAFKIIDPRIFSDTLSAEKARAALPAELSCYVDRFNPTDVVFRLMPDE